MNNSYNYTTLQILYILLCPVGNKAPLISYGVG